MIPRILEPEAMESPEEVLEYDRMDHSEVNARFVADFLAVHGPCRGGELLDVGAGTARIPIALALADPNARVLALDLSSNMLRQAALNIEEAGLSGRIRCLQGDVKGLAASLENAQFEGVISNSILHHIPEPRAAVSEMVRRVAAGGTLMIRDLVRPDSLAQLDHLVGVYAGTESQAAQALFAASLHAALTLDEIRQIATELGLPAHSATITSDRHWTLVWKRPL